MRVRTLPRARLVLALSGLAAAAVLLGMPVQAATADWPMHKGGPSVDGLSPSSVRWGADPVAAQTFATPAAIPSAPVVADLDNDGVQDVLVVHGMAGGQPTTGMQVRFFKGGLGGLTPGWTRDLPFTGANPPTDGFAWLAAGDMDGDGDLEVGVSYNYITNGGAVTNNAAGVAILDGLTGNVLLSAAPGGVVPNIAPLMGDLDGDGRPEFVMARDVGGTAPQPGILAVRHASGVYAVAFTSLYGTGATRGMGLADVRADPGLEVVTLTLQGVLSVCTALPGALSCAETLQTVTSGGGLAVGDLDNDGTPEAVLLGYGAIRYGVAKLVPSLSFASRNDGYYMFTTPAIADFNGDGAREFVSVEWHTYVDVAKSGNVRVRSYTSTPFAQVTDYGIWNRPAPGPSTPPGQETASPHGPVLLDLDRNGRPEILFGTMDGNLVAANVPASAGAPTQRWTLPLGAAATSAPAIGDFNNDCRPDIAIGTAAGLRTFSDTTSPITLPQAPTGLAATGILDPNRIELSWQALSPATDGGSPVTKYNIWRGNAPGSYGAVPYASAPGTTFTDTSVQVGQKYHYAVSAVTCRGDGPKGPDVAAELPDTTPPTTVSDLAVTFDGGSTARVTWTAPTDNVGVVAQELFWRVGPGVTAADASFALPGNAVKHLHPDRETFVRYCYRVRGVDAMGNMAPLSNEACLTMPDPFPPSQPGLLTAQHQGGTKIKLTWGASTDNVGIQGYEVFYSASPGVTTSSQRLPPAGLVDGLSYVHAGLDPDTTLYYRVRAVDVSGGPGPLSNEASATTPSLLPAPRSFTAVVAQGTPRNIQLGNDPGLVYLLDTPPINAQAHPLRNGVRYVPDAGFCGTDHFTFLATDGELDSAPATVTVQVLCAGADGPPVTRSHAYATVEGRAVEVVLFAYDPDGDAITYYLEQSPRGTLTGTPPTLLYTPPLGFTGTDQMTYFVMAGGELSELATIHVHVDPPRECFPAGLSGLCRVAGAWRALPSLS